MISLPMLLLQTAGIAALVLAVIITIAFFLAKKLHNRPKGTNLNEVLLMKNGATTVLLQHDTFTGKVYLNVNGNDVEIFQLPDFSIKRTIVFVPTRVKGIDEISVTRPLIKAPIRNGWKYLVKSGNKIVEKVI